MVVVLVVENKFKLEALQSDMSMDHYITIVGNVTFGFEHHI